MLSRSDTIAALATPVGTAALALLRVSGPDTPRLATEIFGRPPLPRVARHGDYRDAGGTLLDDVVLTFFESPSSYTGEHALEISCHGNPYIAQRILEDLFARGCRPAAAGEFTQRAFLNSRMDLSQAEAVIDLIHARSERALTAANQQLRGSLGRRMSELIDGIMAYSQVSGGNAHEDIDLNLIVENVLVDLEVFIKEKEVSVKVSKLPQITGIKIQMHQLFSNLILNAIKYNQRLPEINISAVLTNKTEIPESDNEAAQEFHKITISDNGIGFEKKYAEDIFTMFKRLHSKDQYTGAGIGLALVKKIVANHGGYIKVNSEPGKGSDFSIYLPVNQK